MGLRPGDPGFREAMREAFRSYHERNTLCRAEGCCVGSVALDPTDIDTYTGAPRTSHCPACQGRGFVPRQQELPF